MPQPTPTHKPLVSILIATCNGETYLKEQLDSITQQTHEHWTIIASDDGSTDGTVPILKQYNATVYNGPHQGFAANFLSLITKAETDSDYYAFADQDDVWDPNKLTRALAWLETVPKDVPALYSGRTHLVDEQLMSIGYSPLFKRKPCFKHALAQTIGGGNTMVFNKAALTLLRQTTNHSDIVSHDWWTYLLVSGSGGEVFYDVQPYVHYRQHASNLVGSNSTWRTKLYRMQLLFKGQLKQWINLNNKSLLAVSYLLTPENKLTLEQFEIARQSCFSLRLIKILRLGIYRQTLFGQLGFMVGALFNKI